MKAFLVTLALTMVVGSTSFARDCIWKSDIRDFFSINDQSIELWTASGVFEVSTRICSGLRFAERIGFRTFPRNAYEVCEGDTLLVYDAFGRTITNRCRITDIDRR